MVAKNPQKVKFHQDFEQSTDVFEQSAEAVKQNPDIEGASAGQQESAGSSYFNNKARSNRKRCPRCPGKHLLYRCPDFQALTLFERCRWVKMNDVCSNCLQKSHAEGTCTSRYGCKFCMQRHNTLLHFPTSCGTGTVIFHGYTHGVVTCNKVQSRTADIPPSTRQVQTRGSCPIQLQVTVNHQVSQLAAVHDSSAIGTPVTAVKAEPSQSVQYTSAAVTDTGNTLGQYTPVLGTAQVPVLNNEGKIVYGRALMDSGSHLNFVTTSFASQLGLNCVASTCAVQTVGTAQPYATRASVLFTLALADGSRLKVCAHILPQVTGVLPPQKIVFNKSLSPIRGDLADSKFNQPGEIDILIGCEIYEELMLGEKKKYDKLTATDSRLGWVITGTGVSAKIESETTAAVTPGPFSSAHARLADTAGLSFREDNFQQDRNVPKWIPPTSINP